MPYALTDKDLARYWSKIDKTDACWLWQGPISSGYGHLKVRGKNVKAHRIAYALAHGREPALHVLHTCDTPTCVNPAHLYEGTDTDNVRDRMTRGRSASHVGMLNGRAVLTEHDVRIIRVLVGIGLTRKEVGTRYGVTTAQVSRIARKQQWSHVTE